MAKITVPPQVFPGFKILTELTDVQLKLLVDYLKELKAGRFYGDLAKDLTDILNVNGDDLLRVILSFTELASEEEDDDMEVLSKNLADSYKELSRVGINTKETSKLKANLFEILQNFDNVKLSELVREYKLENSNNLRGFKLLTDVRFIEANKTPEKKDNFGIILHKLYLNYQNSLPDNELHLHLKIDDLIKLKVGIDEAIERDKVLRTINTGDIKLI